MEGWGGGRGLTLGVEERSEEVKSRVVYRLSYTTTSMIYIYDSLQQNGEEYGDVGVTVRVREGMRKEEERKRRVSAGKSFLSQTYCTVQ